MLPFSDYPTQGQKRYWQGHQEKGAIEEEDTTEDENNIDPMQLRSDWFLIQISFNLFID